MMSSNAFRCSVCSQTFEKRSQRSQHVQQYHQMETVVKFPNGERVKIERDLDTKKFKCPKCGFESEWPKALQRHASQKCMKTKPSQVIDTVHNRATMPAENVEPPNFGLVVNDQIGALVCAKCKCCIGHEVTQVLTHLNRQHHVLKKNLPSAATITSLLGSTKFCSDEELAAYPGDRTEPRAPVDGLPVFSDGKMCGECKYLCRDIRAMRRHLKNKSANATCVSLQTLFVGPKLRYFVVNTPPPEETSVGITLDGSRSDVIREFAAYVNGLEVDESDDRLVPPILRKLKWHNKLSLYTQCESATLIQICRRPPVAPDHVIENVRAAVAAYFRHGTSLITTAPYLTLRFLMAGSLDVKDCHTAFDKVDDTSGNYQRHMMRVLNMVKTCYDLKLAKTPVWEFSTCADVDTAVEGLYEVCSGAECDPSSYEVILQLQHVLEAIFTSELQSVSTLSNDDLKSYTVYRYVVLASITGGDLDKVEILEVQNITSICAALVYWARLFVLFSIVDHNASPRRQTIEELLSYLQDGKPTPCNSLFEIMKLGKSLSGPSEGQRPIGYWKDSQKGTYICKGAVVTKQKMQRLAADVVSQLKDQLQWRLLRCFDTFSARQQISAFEFTDLINVRVVGQWFMSRPENKIDVTPGEFLSHLVSSGMQGQSGEWNENKVREWLHECDEFMDLFLFTVHLTCGQPARASELASLRLRDSNLAYRSVLAVRNRITFLSCYHKSMNVTGKFKPVARFAPILLNADILLYFYLVRPVQAYLHEIVTRDGNGGSFVDAVFVKAGRPMRDEQIRKSIAKGFAAFSDMRLDVSTYRHVAIAFMEVCVRPGLIPTDLLDEQAGHSHLTASTIYARSANDPSTLSRGQLDKFWNASQEWQAFLGLEMQSANVADQTQADNSSQAAATSPAITNGEMQVLQTRNMSRTEKLSFLRFNTGVSSNIRGVNEDSSSYGVPAAAFAKAKLVVERFVGDANARFASAEQGLAIATILCMPPHHRLVVLPTGGGKSLLYMAHFIANPESDKMILVIVPSAALLNESVVKCNLKRVSACKYSGDLVKSGKHYNLVFAAVEQIRLEAFRNYLTLQANLSRLHMVFVDEAHLVMTAASYRPDMLFVPTLIEFGVPLTLLSATAPSDLANDLSTVFRVDFKIIRGQTNRPNLTYNVHMVACPFTAALSAMKAYQEQAAGPGSKTRCIVYCMTRKEVDRLAQLATTTLVVSTYHAKMDPQQQSKSIAQWRRGISIWMIATSAFGVGIDYPHVRLVLHVGAAYSMIDYAQEVGRAGRDGVASEAHVFTSKTYQQMRARSIGEQASAQFETVTQFFNDNEQCRRERLQLTLDGFGLPCLSDNANEKCDTCKNIGEVDEVRTRMDFSEGYVQRTGEIAREINSQTRVIQGEIIDFLSGLSGSECPLCWVRGPKRHYENTGCGWLGYGCLKCQQHGHGSRTCKFALRFQSGTCFTCGLPQNGVGDIGSMHPESFRDCTNPAKGFVIEASWASFHNGDFESFPTDPQEFARWLPKPSNTCHFSNLVCLFYRLIKTKGAVCARVSSGFPASTHTNQGHGDEIGRPTDRD